VVAAAVSGKETATAHNRLLDCWPAAPTKRPLSDCRRALSVSRVRLGSQRETERGLWTVCLARRLFRNSRLEALTAVSVLEPEETDRADGKAADEERDHDPEPDAPTGRRRLFVGQWSHAPFRCGRRHLLRGRSRPPLGDLWRGSRPGIPRLICGGNRCIVACQVTQVGATVLAIAIGFVIAPTAVRTRFHLGLRPPWFHCRKTSIILLSHSTPVRAVTALSITLRVQSVSQSIANEIDRKRG
jgi:hypothetical protein